MEYSSTHSTIVMIGDSFQIGVFDMSAHEQVLGKLDHSRTVVMPIFGDYAFVDSPFHIQIQPNKVQIDFRNHDILPHELQDVATDLALALTAASPEGLIRAIGINLNLVITGEELGVSGIDYCARHFISDPDKWEEYLSPGKGFSAAGRLVYDRKGIKYTIRFEPHYKSDMNNLYIDINAHQANEQSVTDSKALNRYKEIRSYILEVLDRALATE